MARALAVSGQNVPAFRVQRNESLKRMFHIRIGRVVGHQRIAVFLIGLGVIAAVHHLAVMRGVNWPNSCEDRRLIGHGPVVDFLTVPGVKAVRIPNIPLKIEGGIDEKRWNSDSNLPILFFQTAVQTLCRTRTLPAAPLDGWMRRPGRNFGVIGPLRIRHQ